jgi:threonine/homoserine/homoserine lactone efflux protein
VEALTDGESLLAFIAAALVVLLTPGPGVIYVVTLSLTQGRRAGLLSVLGLSAGALIQVAAAAVGLSVILLASSAMFSIVKWLGGGYLIYLGVRALTAADRPETVLATARSDGRVFIDGVVVSVFNPKIAMFFLAFLPQFVDASRTSVPQQILMLGCLYVALAIVTDGMYALFASSLRPVLRGRVMGSRVPRYASGAVYIGLGITALLSERRK